MVCLHFVVSPSNIVYILRVINVCSTKHDINKRFSIKNSSTFDQSQNDVKQKPKGPYMCILFDNKTLICDIETAHNSSEQTASSCFK